MHWKIPYHKICAWEKLNLVWKGPGIIFGTGPGSSSQRPCVRVNGKQSKASKPFHVDVGLRQGLVVVVPDDWGQPDGRAPRGSCFAISAHLSDRGAGTRTTTLRRRDVGAAGKGSFCFFPFFFSSPTPRQGFVLSLLLFHNLQELHRQAQPDYTHFYKNK